MARKKTIDSKEVGLEVGLLIMKFFIKSEYLHYGFFTPDIPVDAPGLAKAQQQYADYLMQRIPQGTKTILDVGGGSGKFAKDLAAAGYEVTMVSPSKLLNAYAEKLSEGSFSVNTKKFEQFESTKTYDLVLFSESFQYIPMKTSFEKCQGFLKPGGSIMICDFFKTGAPGKSQLGGGHAYKDWEEVQAAFPNFKLADSEDITEQTAPTIDLVNKLNNELIEPVYRLLLRLLDDRYPLVGKFIRWKFKKKLEKLENKHFTGQRNGENFKIHKKYMYYRFTLAQ